VVCAISIPWGSERVIGTSLKLSTGKIGNWMFGIGLEIKLK
jgi:hypothetical protein